MDRIIAIANQKGGVGKTTTSINLSSCLADLGKKVLLVDIDPQGNATSGVGIIKQNLENTVYELFLDECTISECLTCLLYTSYLVYIAMHWLRSQTAFHPNDHLNLHTIQPCHDKNATHQHV